MKSKLYIITMLILFLLSAYMYGPVYGSPDDATWQNTIDGTRKKWWHMETGDIWTFVRFYPYGDEQFTIKLWRQNNPDDLSALKFDSGTMYWWWKTNNSWVTIGQYPENQCWLETAIHHSTRQMFYLRYAETDVTIYYNLDFENICPEAYAELYDLGFGNSQWQGLNDFFEYELKFYGGSVAFDYTEGGSSQDLFFYPLVKHVTEDFDDDDFVNWDSSSVTCNSSYVLVANMTIAKFWITGTEPNTPISEDVDKPWWDNIREQFLDTITRMWSNVRSQLSNIPVIGDFFDALWSFLDWGYGILSSVWIILIGNLDVLLTIIMMGYFGTMLVAIVSGRVQGIKDAFMTPMHDARSFMDTVVGIVQAIWDYLKLW